MLSSPWRLLQYSGLLSTSHKGLHSQPQEKRTDEPNNNVHMLHPYTHSHTQTSVTAAAKRKRKNMPPSSTRFDWSQAKHFFSPPSSLPLLLFLPPVTTTTPPPNPVFFFLSSFRKWMSSSILFLPPPQLRSHPRANLSWSPWFCLFKYLICKQS